MVERGTIHFIKPFNHLVTKYQSILVKKKLSFGFSHLLIGSFANLQVYEKDMMSPWNYTRAFIRQMALITHIPAKIKHEKNGPSEWSELRGLLESSKLSINS